MKSDRSKLRSILGAFCLFLAACVPAELAQSSPTPIKTAVSPTQSSATTIIPSATPTASPTPPPTQTPTYTPFPTSPVTPSPIHTPPPFITATPYPQVEIPEQFSEEVEGWYRFDSQFGTFRFSFPPIASVAAFIDDCVLVSLYGAGFIQISPAAIGPATSCQPISLAAFNNREVSRTQAINEQQIVIDGVELSTETALKGELFRLPLPDGATLEFGILPNRIASESPEVIRAVLNDMIGSIRLSTPLAVEGTATPIPAACFDSAIAPASPSGLLRVTFARGGQEWLWREETGMAEPITSPSSGLTLPDGIFEFVATENRVAYLRTLNLFRAELWVSDLNGENGRLLSTISDPNISETHEWATQITVDFRWLSDQAHLLVSLLPDASGLGDSPIKTVWLINATTGEQRLLLDEVPDFYVMQESANGRYLITLLPNEVRLIDLVTTESTTLSLPQRLYGRDNPIHFTPDGEQIILFADEQLALIDLTDFSVRLTPLPYAPIGISHNSAFPTIHWHPDGTRFLTMTLEQSNPNFNDVFAEGAMFAIWEVTLDNFSARLINRFEGNLFMTTLSPTQRHLVTMRQHMSNERWLYLADVQTGELALYDQGELITFKGWSPDGSRFAYDRAGEPPQVGQLCQPPQSLGSLAAHGEHPFRWVDSGRFLYFEGSPETNESNTLFLIGLDGRRTVVAQLDTAFAKFDFYFE